MSSAPRAAPSSRNWTPATVPLSPAFAVTDTDAETVAPDAGAVIATVGGVVSAAATPLRLVSGRADVAGDVLGGDVVVVGARREAAVGVARPGRLRDPVSGATA